LRKSKLKKKLTAKKKLMKIEGEVKGEQGLAALAFGKFEEVYEIEGSRQKLKRYMKLNQCCQRLP
jgi:hypothetical protein